MYIVLWRNYLKRSSENIFLACVNEASVTSGVCFADSLFVILPGTFVALNIRNEQSTAWNQGEGAAL